MPTCSTKGVFSAVSGRPPRACPWAVARGRPRAGPIRRRPWDGADRRATTPSGSTGPRPSTAPGAARDRSLRGRARGLSSPAAIRRGLPGGSRCHFRRNVARAGAPRHVLFRTRAPRERSAGRHIDAAPGTGVSERSGWRPVSAGTCPKIHGLFDLGRTGKRQVSDPIAPGHAPSDTHPTKAVIARASGGGPLDERRSVGWCQAGRDRVSARRLGARQRGRPEILDPRGHWLRRRGDRGRDPIR